MMMRWRWEYQLFFFNDTATTEIYTLSLHDDLPILKEKGEYFDLGLNKIKKEFPKIISEIRGLGLMKGIKLLVDNTE